MAQAMNIDVIGNVPDEIVEIAGKVGADKVLEGKTISGQFYIKFSGEPPLSGSISGRPTSPIDILQVIPRYNGATVVVTKSN